MKKSRIDEKLIEFKKWLKIKSKIKAIYTDEVVRSGTSARINSKIEFLKHPALIVILPKGEKLLCEKK